MLTAGVDIGSVATKAVIWADGRVLAREAAATGSRPKRTAQTVLESALARAGRFARELERVVSTGYGRRLVEFGDRSITEITACALGTNRLNAGRPPVRTIIDLGGQDIKAISLDERGNIRDFLMNDKCAAGTGRFLEVMARALEVPLEELGRLSLQSDRPASITATCTVFAESEVVSLLAQDVKPADILAGLHASIAERIAAMAHKLRWSGPVAFNGGGAKNEGLRAALEAKLGEPLWVTEEPQYVNAVGAACAAETPGTGR